MPNQVAKYVLGGIFVVVITIMGALVSQTLLKQDKVVSFEAPMHEFVETLSREFDYNGFALRSLAQLFRSSQAVEEHEFASYTRLIMQQFGDVVAMAYLKELPEGEEQQLTLIYWQNAFSDGSTTTLDMLKRATATSFIEQDFLAGQAFASPIFAGDAANQYYSFVLLQISPNDGVVGILVDVGKSLEQALVNDISEGYALFERDGQSMRLLFSQHQSSFNEESSIESADFVGTLLFFNREWTVAVYQNELLHRKIAYSVIPFGTLALSSLIVYLLLQAQQLRKVNSEKQSAFEDLKFAQKKLVENEKLSAMGGLVAGVAHEVNTPLGVGITSTSYLQDCMKELRHDFNQGRLDAERFKDFMETGDEMVSLTLNNLRRASNLVAKFKKVDVFNSESDIPPETVYVVDIIDSFMLRFHEQYPDSQVKITADIEPSARVTTYPSVVQEILHALASNSITHGFTPEQSNCEITITFPFENGSSKTNLLCFKDNGKGVDKSVLKRIIDPFFTTRRGAGSAGLGLSVVYNLVTGKLNSDLNFYVDKGLILTFELHDLNK